MRLASHENTRSGVQRAVLRSHIGKTTTDANIPLRSLERQLPWPVLLLPFFVAALILYQVLKG